MDILELSRPVLDMVIMRLCYNEFVDIDVEAKRIDKKIKTEDKNKIKPQHKKVINHRPNGRGN